MRNAWLLALAAGAAACGGPTAHEPALVEVANGDTVTVRMSAGTTAQVDGIEIVFVDVTEDSRCPTDVQCVWEGNGRITLRLTAGAETRTVSLNTATEPLSVAFAGRTFRIGDLEPLPRTDREIPQRDYRVLLALVPE